MRRLLPSSWFRIFEHIVTSPIVRVQVHVVVFASTVYVFYASSDWYGSYRTSARFLFVVLTSVALVDNTKIFPRLYEFLLGLLLVVAIGTMGILNYVADAITGRCDKSKIKNDEKDTQGKKRHTNEGFEFTWDDDDDDDTGDGMDEMD